MDRGVLEGVRVLLVRHAESTGNAEGIMQGAGDYPLSDRGRNQAEAVADVFGVLGVPVIVASNLSRAIDTAFLTLGRVDLVDPRLAERGAGPWTGRPREELDAVYPRSVEDLEWNPEGFEPMPTVIERMRAACIDMLRANTLVVAFTHGAVMRALESELTGLPARRFGHLEGLALGDGLRCLRRVPLLVNQPV